MFCFLALAYLSSCPESMICPGLHSDHSHIFRRFSQSFVRADLSFFQLFLLATCLNIFCAILLVRSTAVLWHV